ncbi:MAG: hypothetical protein F4Y18_07870 [Cenarchaeum sp. SB0663_bin_5]|nr:hypothetical protein [Cenarchaeum sp. SB0663_bin_5]MYH04134.1 hypothetical protein [Cenarchaeum sp. SB0675_bin_21]MYL11229.1 hypothetical protein [Cenarchaeum sp. SB0669_bin_11]
MTPSVGWHLHLTYPSTLESVQHLDVSGDGPDLAEPAAVVQYNEPVVQLVTLGLFAAEDTLYNAALVALLLIEYLGHPASVRLAVVNRDASLLDIGCNLHLEQYMAVVV